MAYIGYGQATTGGKQLAEIMASIQRDVDRLRDIVGWMSQIGAAGLEASPDFLVAAGSGQAFNDTLAQINTDLITFMDTNREKIERLARGS